ncbi:hypothetical protein N7495_004238 [Penicillium taxi]|uniref:uncharacterized protein n=1 Tax=Penicillium taxi TaxID=168475 RepID=UPI0025455279|nr:uncharacterized protein N7495_004238 [Penicillium taxi]KAJ5899494.1 hypothetical protein N7495_004238 [Penicillium taxi]
MTSSLEEDDAMSDLSDMPEEYEGVSQLPEPMWESPEETSELLSPAATALEEEFNDPQRIRPITLENPTTAFWALCWFADLQMLRNFLDLGDALMFKIVCANNRRSVLSWIGRAHAPKRKRSHDDMEDKETESEEEKCGNRDLKKCVLTGDAIAPDIAYIYSYALNADMSLRCEVWDLLELFWTPEKKVAWLAGILGPNGTEQCLNMLSLSPIVYRYWSEARFALKPVGLSDTHTLLVQIYWLKVNPTPNTTTRLLLRPSLACEGGLAGPGLGLYSHKLGRLLVSGDVIAIKTSDPEKLPLPSIEILTLQWNLLRVAALCTGGEEDEDEMSDIDDDGDEMSDSDDGTLFPVPAKEEVVEEEPFVLIEKLSLVDRPQDLGTSPENVWS